MNEPRVFAVPKYLPGERVQYVHNKDRLVAVILGRVYTRRGRVLYVVEYENTDIQELHVESDLEPAD